MTSTYTKVRDFLEEHDGLGFGIDDLATRVGSGYSVTRQACNRLTAEGLLERRTSSRHGSKHEYTWRHVRVVVAPQ